MQRLPLERVFKHDRDKDFESFQQSLKEKGLLEDTATLSHPLQFPTRNRRVSPDNSLSQQRSQTGYGWSKKPWDIKRETYAGLYLAEGHAKEDFMGCAADVHCGFKHGLNLVALAQETKSMHCPPLPPSDPPIA